MKNIPRPLLGIFIFFVVLSTIIIYEQVSMARNMDSLAPDLRKNLKDIPFNIHVPAKDDRPACDWTCQTEEQLDQQAVLLIQPSQYSKRVYTCQQNGYRMEVFVPFSRRAQQLISHEPNACYVGKGFTLLDRKRFGVPYEYEGQPRELAFNTLYFKHPQSGQRAVVAWGFMLSTKANTGNILMVKLHNLLQQVTKMRPASCMKIQIHMDINPVAEDQVGRQEQEQIQATQDFLEQFLPHLESCFPEGEKETS
jgi:hypothetical protein